jgi:hypothetical protein
MKAALLYILSNRTTILLLPQYLIVKRASLYGFLILRASVMGIRVKLGLSGKALTKHFAKGKQKAKKGKLTLLSFGAFTL